MASGRSLALVGVVERFLPSSNYPLGEAHSECCQANSMGYSVQRHAARRPQNANNKNLMVAPERWFNDNSEWIVLKKWSFSDVSGIG
jgi:hypothetical protein